MSEIPKEVIHLVVNNIVKGESWNKYKVDPNAFDVLVEPKQTYVYNSQHNARTGKTIIHLGADFNLDSGELLALLVDHARRAVKNIPQERRSVALIPFNFLSKNDLVVSMGEKTGEKESFSRNTRFAVSMKTMVEVRDKKTGLIETEECNGSNSFDMAERAAERLKRKIIQYFGED